MKDFRFFFVELVAFVALGVVNTMTLFGYIQKSLEDQAGMWMIFLSIGILILIHLLLTLMEVQKQSSERHKLELLLDGLFRQIKREGDDVQTRLINESIETMQLDPSSYENYLRNLKDDTKAMIKKRCDKHIVYKQRHFGEDLVSSTGRERTIPVYRSDVLFKRSGQIEALETLSNACENT